MTGASSPASCTLTVEGKGKVGFVKGVGNIDMTEQGPGKTLMKYTGEVQIGGKVASVGQRLFGQPTIGEQSHDAIARFEAGDLGAHG